MEPISWWCRIKHMALKTFSRSLLFVVLVFAFVMLTLPLAAQDEGSITMDVQAGYDGYYKTEHLLPVFVTLTNDGPLVEGELRITLGSRASGNRVVYNTPVSLPTQSNKRVPIYVYPVGFISGLTVELLNENGRSLLESTSNPLRQKAQESLLYGVVTPTPGNLDYLEDVTGGRSEATVAYFNLDDLPELPPAWNGLDVLVLHDVDTGQLSAGQMDALEKWLHTGGQLVVAGGVGWQKTAASLADILPVAITGSETVEDLPALQAVIGEPFRDPGPYLVTVSSLTNGEMLLHEDGLPLLAKRPFSLGNVFFLALDPSLAPLLDWAGSEIVWAQVAESIPSLSPWAGGIQNGWAAVEAVSSLPILAMPPVFQLIAYLLIYIFIIGPVNYWVLKRKNRRELAWVTIPIMVFVFAGLTYFIGFQLKGNDTIINQMSVVTGEVGSEDVRVDTLLGLYSPRRRSYDVVLPADSMARPLSSYGSNNASVEAITRGSELILTDVRVDVSGVETFVVESVRTALPITSKATLVAQDGKIELLATIRNDSEQTLENVVLLIGANAVKLGDLKPGQERSTTETVGSVNESGLTLLNPSGYGSPLMRNSSAIVGTSNYYDDPVAFPKFQLLQALEDEYLAGNTTTSNNNLMLTAWTDETQLETAVQDQVYDSLATTFYLLEVPLLDELEGTRVVVPLNLLNWTILGSNNMYSESVTDFYMPASSWMEVEFTPWRELADLTVQNIEIHLENQSGQTHLTLPSVRLWDWQAEEWVDLEDAGWGQTAVTDPQTFLNEENTMRLRLQNKGQTSLDIRQFFPILTGDLK